MKRILLRRLKPDDLQHVNPGLFDLFMREGVNGPSYTGYDATNEDGGHAEDEAEIVFCCGVQNIFQHSGEAWFEFGPNGKGYVNAFKVIRELLHHHIIPRYNYSRVQATADLSVPETVRFLEHLGFEREGVLRAYGPQGQDMAMYAVIPGGRR